MRLLRPLLLAVLALLLVPLTATSAQAADGTISGTALDANGKPLRNVYWDIYTWDGDEWSSELYFGPKLTNAKGRFSYKVPVGGKYRVCFQDSYYQEDFDGTGFWQPEVRHRDTCWPNATSVDAAQTWTSTAAAPSKHFTVTMAKQGLGMAPVQPFAVGTYDIGKPLTVIGQEGWRPTNATFTYRWMSLTSDGARPTPIPGATSATFVPTSAQSGKGVWAEVTATRAGYKPVTWSTAYSKVGVPHAQPLSPLKITGSAKPGSTLTASFTKAANTRSELTWFVDGVPQPKYTGWEITNSRFPVTAAHAGARIDVRLSIYLADEVGYIDGSSTFHRAQVQVSGSRPAQPLRTVPAVKGTATVGRVLVAPRTVTADPAERVSYQWTRSGAAIKGATANRYKVRAADVNRTLRVRVTVSRPGWWNTYTSTSTAAVAKRALKKGTVKVTGTAKVGKKLKAKTAKWGPKPVKVRYRWLRNGKPIKGATKATYKVKKADRRKVIKVRVTVKKPKYLTVVKTSKGRKIKR